MTMDRAQPRLSRRAVFTAAGATIAGTALAAVPVITVASAEERLRHHRAGLEATFRDLFPTAQVVVRGNCLNGEHVHFADRFMRYPTDSGALACAMVMAHMADPSEAK